MEIRYRVVTRTHSNETEAKNEYWTGQGKSNKTRRISPTAWSRWTWESMTRQYPGKSRSEQHRAWGKVIRIKSDLLRLVPTLCGAIPRTGFATTFIFREREVSGAGARPCSPQPPTLSICQPGARTWIKYRESRSSMSRVSRPHETLRL